jgi:hypothetical protein
MSETEAMIKRIITGDSTDFKERLAHEALEFVVYGVIFTKVKDVVTNALKVEDE